MLGNEKSETDLRKMIKIMEESLKIEKKRKNISHMRSHPRKGTKSKKDISCIVLDSIAVCPLTREHSKVSPSDFNDFFACR